MGEAEGARCGRSCCSDIVVLFCWLTLCSMSSSCVTGTLLPEVFGCQVPYFSKSIVNAFSLGGDSRMKGEWAFTIAMAGPNV